MDVFSTRKKKGVEVLEVEDAWKCTMCRECIRPEKFRSKINLGKERQVYKFHVESVGVLKPEEIFLKAMRVLKEKCDHYLLYLKTLKKERSKV